MHPLIGECVGTFILCVCILYLTKSSAGPVINQVFVASMMGVALTVGIMVSNVTGGHSYLNPVVAVTSHATGKLSATSTVQVIAAECVGAALAFLYVQN